MDWPGGSAFTMPPLPAPPPPPPPPQAATNTALRQIAVVRNQATVNMEIPFNSFS